MANKKELTPYTKMVMAFGRVCPDKNPTQQDMEASERAIENYRNYRNSKPVPLTTEQIIQATYDRRCGLKTKIVRKKRA